MRNKAYRKYPELCCAGLDYECILHDRVPIVGSGLQVDTASLVETGHLSKRNALP